MTGRSRTAYRLYQLTWISLDWLFPPRCGGCGRSGSRWCLDCQQTTQRVLPPICPRCGQPQFRDGLCKKCRQATPQYRALRSWGVFAGPLRNALHRLKYRRDIALGEALARHLIEMLEALNWTIDQVVPVPLGLARQAERGYNQAALLAKPLALGCHLDYNPGSLLKIRNTPSQVGLSFEQRWVNVAGSFEAISKQVAGKSLLVIDDVVTSGATINACAEALLAAGASQVYALTLARAP